MLQSAYTQLRTTASLSSSTNFLLTQCPSFSSSFVAWRFWGGNKSAQRTTKVNFTSARLLVKSLCKLFSGIGFLWLIYWPSLGCPSSPFPQRGGAKAHFSTNGLGGSANGLRLDYSVLSREAFWVGDWVGSRVTQKIGLLIGPGVTIRLSGFPLTSLSLLSTCPWDSIVSAKHTHGGGSNIDDTFASCTFCVSVSCRGQDLSTSWSYCKRASHDIPMVRQSRSAQVSWLHANFVDFMLAAATKDFTSRQSFTSSRLDRLAARDPMWVTKAGVESLSSSGATGRSTTIALPLEVDPAIGLAVHKGSAFSRCKSCSERLKL